MTDISLNADLKTEAEYIKEVEALMAEMAEMDDILAQMGKSCVERERFRAETDRLAAKNKAALATIAAQSDVMTTNRR